MNEKPKKSKCEGMGDSFKSFDWFGQTINLRYKGEEEFKTIVGASMSYLLVMVLLGFGIFKAFYLFNRYNPEIYKVSFKRDMTDGFVFRP